MVGPLKGRWNWEGGTPDRQGGWAMAPEGPGRAWWGTGQREQNVQQVMPCQGLGGGREGTPHAHSPAGEMLWLVHQASHKGLGSRLKGSGSGAGQ